MTRPDAERDHLARWSLRGRTSHEIRDGVTVRHTIFYQPIWGNLADYLLRSDTGLKVLLTERLALSVEYQLKRDARPPDEVEPNDRLLTTGIIIDF
jgi:putative salt-induced outer membrane protein YdiY